MLKSIKITNFKPFGEGLDSIRLAPITLIYGPNSSGKSSIIQSLLLLKQTFMGQQSGGARNDLVTRGDHADLGNFLSILHRHDIERKLRFDFEFVENSEPLRSRQSNEVDNFSGISLSFAARAVAVNEVLPVLDSVELKLGEKKIDEIIIQLDRCISRNTIPSILEGSIDDDEDQLRILNEPLMEREGDFKIRNNSDYSAIHECAEKLYSRRFPNLRNNLSESISTSDRINTESVSNIIKNAKFFSSQFNIREVDYLPCSPRHRSLPENDVLRAMHWLLRAFDTQLRRTIGALTYLGPSRAHPERLYAMQGVPGRSVGAHGEQAVQILYHDLLLGDRGLSLLNRLNNYCIKFEIPYKFSIKRIGDEITGDFVVLSLTDSRTGVSVAPTDVGFGIGQLLPILVEGMVASESDRYQRMVCVEQPEIHLHPRLQAAMADFFIDTSLIRNTRSRLRPAFRQRGGVQWILETHSEALILRLQRRIREGTISAADVCVLYVDPRGEKGSVIQELRLDEDGEFIDLWPDGFFVESFSELMGGR